MLEQVEAGQDIRDLKMDVLQAIQYIIQGWNEVITKTIQNCWYYTKILPFNSDMKLDDETDDLILKELHDTFKVLHLPNVMKVEEFLKKMLFLKFLKMIKL